MNGAGRWLEFVKTVGLPGGLLAYVIWWTTMRFEQQLQQLTVALQANTEVLQRVLYVLDRLPR